MTPLVSILIPAYNAQKWIADTIQSALGQTWPNKEIIIVDDGSRDETLSVARQFTSANVIVLTQQNQGAATARNKAFSVCHGEYIQWLDADDLLSPDKISRQMEQTAQSARKRQLFSSEWGNFMYRSSHAAFSPSSLWQDLSPVEWLLRKLGEGQHMQPATWLVSRELTEDAGPWDDRLSLDDDGEYFARIVAKSDGIRFIPKGRVFYRMAGGNSLSNSVRLNKNLDSQFLSLRLQMRCLLALEDSERTRAACLRYLQKYLFDFDPERPDIVRQMHELAASFGGKLGTSPVPWKYVPIRFVLGHRVTKRLQLVLPIMKTSLLRTWDQTLFNIERWQTSERHSSVRD